MHIRKVYYKEIQFFVSINSLTSYRILVFIQVAGLLDLWIIKSASVAY
jgi:hypothetical protein